jgi:hypothetical protein
MSFGILFMLRLEIFLIQGFRVWGFFVKGVGCREMGRIMYYLLPPAFCLLPPAS